MATARRELTYRCSDDCKQSGCPTHNGVVEHNTISDTFTFNMNGRVLCFERGEMDAMVALYGMVENINGVPPR